MILKMISKKKVFQSILILALLLQGLHSLAQKKFDLTIKLPAGIDKGRIQLYLYDGRHDAPLKLPQSTGNDLVITGKYYSVYAIISIQFQKGTEGTSQVYGTRFFIQEKPASIQLYPSDSTGLDFEKYSLKNAVDFSIEQKQMAVYDSAERREGVEYEAKYGDRIYSGKDREISNYYFQVLRKSLGRKKLEYILRNPDSYYSFWSFRTDIAWPKVLPADSLLLVFNKVFPEKFKYSDEGNFLNEYLHGQLLQQKPGNFIDFTTKDINGKTVTLSKLQDKIVLLHFWATWCSPCMAELPVIKQLNEIYRLRGVQFVSVALKSSLADFNRVMKSQQMNWIQIYDKPDVENKYGNFPVPRICLIDRSGKLIYDNAGINKTDDLKLDQLKQILNGIAK